MTEAPKQFEGMSRSDKAHFIYPVMDKASSSRLQRFVPTRYGRHMLTALLLTKETLKPSKSTKEYWEKHDLPQPKYVVGEASGLIISGWQDFHRIATSGHVRLRAERVRRKKRQAILRNSHELLKVARVALRDLNVRTEPSLPVLGIKYRNDPDFVYFGIRRHIPLRGTVYDANAGVVKLTDTYDKWITRYREAAYQAGKVVGCPAPHTPAEREDGSKTNLLALSWERYVDGVYAGKPRSSGNRRKA